jgi:hypothetical protein
MATQPAFANTWALLNSVTNKVVFDVDTCNEVRPDVATKVSNFPIEDGSFASYNKVKEPFQIKLRLSVSGQARIATFIAALVEETNSTNLYNVVTPEATYLSCTIEKHAYPRTREKGRNTLTVDLTLVEIRQVSVQYASVKIPPGRAKKTSSVSKVDTGKQQPVDPYDAKFSNVKAVDITQGTLAEAATRGYHATVGN